MIDKATPQGLNGHLDHAQEEWLRLMPDGWDGTDLVTECAQLRKERDFYFDQGTENVERIESAYDELGAENVKLRETLKILTYCVWATSDCDKCIMNGKEPDFALMRDMTCDGMADRLHELGIGCEKDRSEGDE